MQNTLPFVLEFDKKEDSLDHALKKLIKSADLPSPNTLRRFLKSFHSDYEPVIGESFVPDENEALYRLGHICRRVVSQAIERSGLEIATIENDATYVESHKDECLLGYKGEGYMPTVAVIAELDMVLCEEFRDGNVAPSFQAIEFFKKSLRVIPKTVTKVRTRLDGAYYQHAFMDFLHEEKIAYTITAQKSESLIEFIEAIKEEDWQILRDKHGTDTGRDYTDLYWTGVKGSRAKMRQHCRRYVITRKRYFQTTIENHLTPEEQKEKKASKYEAIVTSDEIKRADDLIRWHHGKGGHIEKCHDRIKNDLAGSTMPSGLFGVNAAWYRINCLAWNLIRVLQIEALPEKFNNCYLKKLRFWLINIAGRVIETGHQIILKLSGCRESFDLYQEARKRISALEVPT